MTLKRMVNISMTENAGASSVFTHSTTAHSENYSIFVPFISKKTRICSVLIHSSNKHILKVTMSYASWGPIFLETPRNPDNQRPQALSRQLNN